MIGFLRQYLTLVKVARASKQVQEYVTAVVNTIGGSGRRHADRRRRAQNVGDQVSGRKPAGLERVQGGAWHPLRRLWACSRKHLPAKDTAMAGGWVDVQTLQKVYEAADLETLEQVVTGGRRVRGIVR